MFKNVYIFVKVDAFRTLPLTLLYMIMCICKRISLQLININRAKH